MDCFRVANVSLNVVDVVLGDFFALGRTKVENPDRGWVFSSHEKVCYNPTADKPLYVSY